MDLQEEMVWMEYLDLQASLVWQDHKGLPVSLDLEVIGLKFGQWYMAQLVERLLPKPDICGSNPITCKFYSLATVVKKQNKDKERPLPSF